MGPNGAGKTTLLEAVYLAATGRSFRAPRLELCARNGGERFLVHAEVGAAPRRCLEHVWTRATGSHRSLDGKSARLPEQLMALPLLVWTRAESELVAGPPAVRRRFFDRGLVQLRPALWSSLGRFERALAAKRALLAAGGSSGATARELASWNELLARHGAEIAAGRAQLVAELDAHLARLRATSFDDLPELALRYRPSPPAAAAGEAALREALAALAPEERRRRQPLSGAQRDEIEILWAGGEARRIASAEAFWPIWGKWMPSRITSNPPLLTPACRPVHRI